MPAQELLVGRKPQPRALIQGFSETMVRELKALFPTSRVIERITDVRQEEWDILVTREGVDAALSPRILVLAIGGNEMGARENVPIKGKTIQREGLSLATELLLASDAPEVVVQLVKSDLLPKAEKLEHHRVLAEWSRTGGWDFASLLPDMTPFLRSGEGGVIAGTFKRHGGVAECWALPEYADPVQWTRAGLDVWRTQYPAQFAIVGDWRRTQPWTTKDEGAVLAELAQKNVERQAFINEVDGLMEEAKKRLAILRQNADSRERSLATVRSHDLVASVTDCLRELGFEVEDMDAKHPQGRKLEDLRVRLPGKPDWEAIVEVKSYKRGASINDLMKLQGRFRTRFVQETGRPPAGMWFIANTFVGTDPSQREAVFAPNAEEFQTFTEDGGLAAETGVLLQLWLSVQRDELAAADARDLLMTSVGRLSLPTNEEAI